MADVLTQPKRSALMAKVRNSGNASTEQRLLSLFRRHKITGWRRGVPLYGKPDFVFGNARVAVFVDGCFWHACPRHKRLPKSRVAFWQGKLAGNERRDQEVNRALRAAGWRVLRIWEHEFTRKREARLVRRIKGFLG